MELAAMDKMFKSLEKENKKSSDKFTEQIDLLKIGNEEKEQTIFDLQANSYKFKKVNDL